MSDEYRKFFKKEYGNVIGLLIRRGVEANTADDLANETFLRIWQKKDKIEGPAFSYLLRSAINAHLVHVRSHYARNMLTNRPGDLRTLASRHEHSEVEFREFRDGLNNALSRLSDKQREAIRLHLDGVTPTKVAQLTGRTVPSVTRTLKLARLKLAENLEKLNVCVVPYAPARQEPLRRAKRNKKERQTRCYKKMSEAP